MSACIAPLQKMEGTTSRDVDDVDLELLFHHVIDRGGNDQSSRSSSSGAGDSQVLNDSRESIGSIEEDQQHSGKSGFFGKQFLKSLPVTILTKRKVSDPYSELTYSTSSSPALSLNERGSLPHTSGSLPLSQLERSTTCLLQRNGAKKMIWSIQVPDCRHLEDVELPHSSTCALLLHKLLTKRQIIPNLTEWSIIEQNFHELLERFVEDYEIIDDVAGNQDCDAASRFRLAHTPEKYSILQYPELCLPGDMLVIPDKYKYYANVPDRIKRLQMQDVLTKTAPELCGWLHVRKGDKKTWKKLFCILRNSGLYYSTKGTSKEPHHLVCVAEVHTARVWHPMTNSKLKSSFPTAFSFCLKPRSYDHGESICWFCAESNHAKMAWIGGLRLTMNGSRFHQSFLSARRYGPNSLIRSSSDRSINKCEGNFVAMDFTGSTGRIIQDPYEAAMVELERESTWRRRMFRNVNSSNGLERAGSSAPTKDNTFITRAIHLTQSWFYAKISREAAVEEIQRHGSLDGTFLVRDSQSKPGDTVVTVCHNQKPRHIPISLLERDGVPFYTIDNGETRFWDLIQFVDFHRLNKGNLPCPLIYPCRRQCPR